MAHQRDAALVFVVVVLRLREEPSSVLISFHVQSLYPPPPTIINSASVKQNMVTIENQTIGDYSILTLAHELIYKASQLERDAAKCFSLFSSSTWSMY
jgi:hypothetical protein